jgi:hypothetical protein
MRRFFIWARRFSPLVAVVVVAAALSGGAPARAATAAPAASSAPCSLNPATSCSSTDATVTISINTTATNACTFSWTVDWADGSAPSTVTQTNPALGYAVIATHAYQKAGTYGVTAVGHVTAGNCVTTPYTGTFTLVAAPPAATCAAVWFIGARGSGEPASQAYVQGTSKITGMGKEVGDLAFQVRADLASKKLSVGLKPVGYAADSVSDLKPSATELALAKKGSSGVGAALAAYIAGVKRYDASMNQGIKQTEAAVAQVLSSCPKAKLILAGYSQGAVAVHDAENWIAANKPAELSHIAGTLLLGDPDRVPHSKSKLFGSSPASGEGLRVYLHLVLAHDVPKPATTATITNANDLVGDFHGGLSLLGHKADSAIHGAYKTPPAGPKLLASAASWVASKVTAG